MARIFDIDAEDDVYYQDSLVHDSDIYEICYLLESQSTKKSHATCNGWEFGTLLIKKRESDDLAA